MALICNCNYPKSTWTILLGMIISGSLRSVAVKIVYQSGFEAPLTITLLYLLGQSLSLVVYKVDANMDIDVDIGSLRRKWNWKWKWNCFCIGRRMHRHHQLVRDEIDSNKEEEGEDQTQIQIQKVVKDEQKADRHGGNKVIENRGSKALNGSTHGLTVQSEERIQWIHSVPWYVKPSIPALFNLLNSTLRWLSLVYIVASVAEMLFSGLELALSVVAARIFRGRRVSLARWAGVGFVTASVLIIGHVQSSSSSSSNKKEVFLPTPLLDKASADDDDESSINSIMNQNATEEWNYSLFGLFLIILQSILSVSQDMTEEIFMQAADFPPTLMLGLEGAYGLVFGLILYFTIGAKSGVEDPSRTLQLVRADREIIRWMAGLTLLFLLTGIFNIKATEVTSAMTRNVWKNFRTVLVWILSLSIFYLGLNPNYGEAWLNPESIYILLAFIIMFIGIIIYYWDKANHKEQEEDRTDVMDESALKNEGKSPELVELV